MVNIVSAYVYLYQITVRRIKLISVFEGVGIVGGDGGGGGGG